MIATVDIRAAYDTFGYAALGFFFEPGELQRLREGAAFVEEMRPCWGTGEDMSSHQGHVALGPFLHDPRVEAAVALATGAAHATALHGVLHHSAPRSGPRPPQAPETPDSVVTVVVGMEPIVALHPSDGGVTLIPASHRETFKLPGGLGIDDAVRHVCVPPGHALLLHPRLWHGRPANPLRRAAIALALYVRPEPEPV